MPVAPNIGAGTASVDPIREEGMAKDKKIAASRWRRIALRLLCSLAAAGGLSSSATADTWYWKTDVDFAYWDVATGAWTHECFLVFDCNGIPPNEEATIAYIQSGTAPTVATNVRIGVLNMRERLSNPFRLSYNSAEKTFQTDRTAIGLDAQLGGDLTFVQSWGTHKTEQLYLSARGGTAIYELQGRGTIDAFEVVIGDSGKGSFLHGIDRTLSTAMFSQLFLGKAAEGEGSYTLTSGTLSASIEHIGVAGVGAFVQDGGTNSLTNTLALGTKSSGQGSYELRGGTLSAPVQIVGYDGIGTFTQTGGTNLTAGTLWIGVNSVSKGTYLQNGGVNTVDVLRLADQAGSWGAYALRRGTLNAREISSGSGTSFLDLDGGLLALTQPSISVTYLTLGSISGTTGSLVVDGTWTLRSTLDTRVGFSGTGTLTVDGGRHIVDRDLYVGTNVGGSGSYHLKSGEASASHVYVGFGGTGTFVQDGGTFLARDVLALGASATGQGTYSMHSGTLTVKEAVFGYDGSGLFEQFGGTNSASATTWLGARNGSQGTYTQAGGYHQPGVLVLAETSGSRGTYDLRAGTLSADQAVVGRGGMGMFKQSGGSSSFGSSLSIGMEPGSKGEYLLSGGSLSTATLVVRGGSLFAQSGGVLSAFSIEVLQGGKLQLFGGTLNAIGSASNYGTLELQGGSPTFDGGFSNDGKIQVRNTNVVFRGLYTERGALISDPSVLDFHTAFIDADGYWVAGSGDEFRIAGDFVNNSLQYGLWNTRSADLVFTRDATHTFHLPGADLGTDRGGFEDNFAWHRLAVESGASLMLLDGNSAPGGALYIGLLDLNGDLGRLAQINSAFNIYYDPSLAGNAYLGGSTYVLDGGGFLMATQPVPEPGQFALFLAGLLVVLRLRRPCPTSRRT